LSDSDSGLPNRPVPQQNSETLGCPNPRTMTTPNARRLVQLFAELGVIVAGVLIALGADAAWGARNDRQREQAYLVALLGEMEAARDELEGDQENRNRRLAFLDSLEAHFASRGTPPEDMVEWVRVADEIVFFLPPTAVYQDLVTSGTLRLIRSDELRRALMMYDQEVSKLRLMEDRERTVIELSLRPYLIDFFAMHVERVPDDLTATILRDTRFWNLTRERRARLEVTLRYALRVDDAINTIIQLLEGETGLRRGAS